MPQPKLFQPIKIGDLALDNRIVIAPMCQYSAKDGCMTDWHLMHLGNLALSGAGLLIIEATATSADGRISPHCVGLYDSATQTAMETVIRAAKSWSNTPIALQIGHAGRKASTEAPWNGGEQIPADQDLGWETVAPSNLAFRPKDTAPEALTQDQMATIKDQFVDSARRAAEIGIDGLEVHMAHGYLLHQFLSPLTNSRTDNYGGSLENRMRFPLEVFEAVKAEFKNHGPVWVRVSATDWVDAGWDGDQTIHLAKNLEKRGCNAIHVSTGGLDPRQTIPVGPGYQLSFARAIKEAVSMPVMGVGLITEAQQAEDILQNQDTDMIAIARAALYNPRWPWHAAAELGANVTCPPQYQRCQPRNVSNLFKT